MRDSLWIRDNYHGASNKEISQEERDRRIAAAKSHVLSAKKFNDYSKIYIAHCDGIGNHEG
jgi:hypothetical protein